MVYTTGKPIRQLPRFLLISITIGIGLICVFLLIVNLVFSLANSKRILPGVSMDGKPLSGLSIPEAASQIAKSSQFPQTGKIVLVDGTNAWATTPNQLGVYLDALASANSAYTVGRRGSLFTILLERYKLMTGGINAFPTFIYDQKASVSFLAQLATKVNQPIREAGLSISGTEVIVSPGQAGKVLDIPATLDSIYHQVQLMQDGVLPLVIHKADPAILDASLQGELARGILSQPFFLYSPPELSPTVDPLQVTPEILAKLLTFEKVSSADGTQFNIVASKPMLAIFLGDLGNNLDMESKNPRFVFNDDTRQLDLIEPSTIGRTLNVEASIVSINESIQKGEHEARLAFDITNPQVSDQTKGSDLGITELATSYTSYFRGSSNDRVQNIKTASARFHGLLIAPGATLSMSDALGNISLENGYAEALIILGDQTIKGVGGGVCQVSTTLFRTVFFGGYQVLERHPHAYRVGYYEQTAGGTDADLAGLDATVYVPLVDFKFKNDTPYWLLMETYVNSSRYSLTWKFYSTKDGRVVDYSTTGPMNIIKAPDPLYRENPDLAQGTKNKVDWAADGADISVNRTVTLNNQILHQDTFDTHYQAWREVWEYGPGTEGMPPTPTP
jgi:vancomycin resistance protein YoaR